MADITWYIGLYMLWYMMYKATALPNIWYLVYITNMTDNLTWLDLKLAYFRLIFDWCCGVGHIYDTYNYHLKNTRRTTHSQGHVQGLSGAIAGFWPARSESHTSSSTARASEPPQQLSSTSAGAANETQPFSAGAAREPPSKAGRKDTL